jgi:hypothetical protein
MALHGTKDSNTKNSEQAKAAMRCIISLQESYQLKTKANYMPSIYSAQSILITQNVDISMNYTTQTQEGLLPKQ